MRQKPKKRLKIFLEIREKENYSYGEFPLENQFRIYPAKIVRIFGVENTQQPITNFLNEIKTGNKDVLESLLPLVYEELRRLAGSYLRKERSNHTLQPTALVHEAYLRLVGQNEIDWQNRAHFFGVSARLMREILIEYARARNRQKRGGEFKTQIELDSAVSFSNEKQLDIVAVDDALSKLEALDQRQGKIVEMKFFGGLTVDEIGEVLGISPATVKREWSSAKLLLKKILK
jgi:RNA polymerase sigma factor (TIGR02999 family)